MYKTHTHTWYLSLVFATLFAISSLSGQVSLQNRTILDVPERAQLLTSHAGEVVGYWIEDELSLGPTITKYKNEQVLKVLSTTSNRTQQFVVVTIEHPVQFSSRTMAISVMTSGGKEIFSREIDVSWDHAFPSFSPIDGGNRIVITDPQSQEVRLLNEDGTLSEFHSLFSNDERDHEKVIAIEHHSPSHVYLAGMKSAALDQTDNVALFSWNLNDSPFEIKELPLTVLRNISLSTSGYAAISGTVASGQEYNQQHRLILLSLEDFTSFSYTILPKKMIWADETLFAADNRRLIVLKPNSDRPLAEIQFPSRLIPLGLFTAGSSVHLLYAGDSRYSEGKNELGSIGIMTIDQQTLDHSEISVSRDYHKVVNILPIEDGKFFLQLDGELLEYSAD